MSNKSFQEHNGAGAANKLAMARRRTSSGVKAGLIVRDALLAWSFGASSAGSRNTNRRPGRPAR